MKSILTLFMLVNFTFSAVSMASVSPAKKNSELQDKIELMLTELETTKNSPAIEKLILTNIVTAYSNSNIKNAKLKERLDKAIFRLTPALSKKEESLINSKLAKIQ